MTGDSQFVWPKTEHTSEVEMRLEDREAVMVRVGSFGPLLELSPDDARGLGMALVELADLAAQPMMCDAHSARDGVEFRFNV
jgi:hypothetical protein